MLWASKQSSHSLSISTPLVVTAMGISQPVRDEMASQAAAKILHAPQQGLAAMQDDGEIDKGVPGDVFLDTLQQPMGDIIAHQLGLVVNGRVAEPVAIGAIDIASRRNLHEKLRDRLLLECNGLWTISRHADTAMDRNELRRSLVASDETSPAEPAGGTNISSPAKAAGDSTSPDKTASSEVDLGWFVRSGAFFQTLSAYIAQQCVDPLMIALNARARSMQLQEARHNLKREKRHCCAPHARNRTNGRYPSGGVVGL
jgi:hypothetical protein